MVLHILICVCNGRYVFPNSTSSKLTRVALHHLRTYVFSYPQLVIFTVYTKCIQIVVITNLAFTRSARSDLSQIRSTQLCCKRSCLLFKDICHTTDDAISHLVRTSCGLQLPQFLPCREANGLTSLKHRPQNFVATSASF